MFSVEDTTEFFPAESVTPLYNDDDDDDNDNNNDDDDDDDDDSNHL